MNNPKVATNIGVRPSKTAETPRPAATVTGSTAGKFGFARSKSRTVGTSRAASGSIVHQNFNKARKTGGTGVGVAVKSAKPATSGTPKATKPAPPKVNTATPASTALLNNMRRAAGFVR